MLSKTLRRTLFLATAIAAASIAGTALAAKVAVITPYLAQPGTQFYVEAFQDVAKQKGWDVNVIDTQSDVAAVISRIEDMVTQKVDAIVINVDPAQVQAGLQAAKAANIPVFGMDAGAIRCSSPMSRRTAMRWRPRRRPMSPTASAARAMS